jgi:hypothetical protein
MGFVPASERKSQLSLEGGHIEHPAFMQLVWRLGFRD